MVYKVVKWHKGKWKGDGGSEKLYQKVTLESESETIECGDMLYTAEQYNELKDEILFLKHELSMAEIDIKSLKKEVARLSVEV